MLVQTKMERDMLFDASLNGNGTGMEQDMLFDVRMKMGRDILYVTICTEFERTWHETC